MFDTFEAFQQLEHQSFDFQPSRFKVWKSGQMIDSGITSGLISNRVTQSPVNKGNCSVITFNDSDLSLEISAENYFDIFFTGTDRLQIATIPANGNNTECVGLNMLKNIIGPTRRTKSFLNNEPYCCNLFLQNSTISKITFSFNAPEKLMEFYQ